VLHNRLENSRKIIKKKSEKEKIKVKDSISTINMHG
jgi:hypothetical protein